MIRLQTLGSLGLYSSEGSELRAVLAQPRRLALLAYLGVARPHGFHRRDKLVALFWPDRDSERSRASLNRAVYFLRRELGDDVLLSRGDEEVALDRARFWCDTAALGDALDDHRYREALDLYRGDLLPGFFVSDAPGFEQWLESERAHVKERASVAAWTLADDQEAAGNLAQAAQWARRGLELSPFREVGLRRLLAMLDRAGDRAGAAHAYERFAAEITAELDLDPSPETRALIDAIRSRATVRGEVPVSANGAIDIAMSSGPKLTGSPATTPGTVDAASPPRGLLGQSAGPAAPRRRRAIAAAVSLAALGIVLVTAKVVLARDTTIDPLRIDVATFENRTGDPSLDNLARLTTDRIIGGLGQTGLFKSIAPLPPPAPRWLWASLNGLRERVRRERGGVIVSGTLSRESGVLLVHARLTDIRHGGTVWPVAPVVVTPTSPEQAASELRARVIGGAAALRNPYFAGLLPVASSPPTFEAFQEFFEGQQLQASRRPAEARSHFYLAVALDSSFTWPLVQAALSALFEMRDPRMAEADSVLRVLNGMRHRIPPLQLHLTDYMLTSRAQDWVGAYRAIREAASIAPLHYSYAVASRASSLGRPREAVEALIRPGMDSAHQREAESYWLMLTASYHQLGEHGNELDAARRARKYRPDSRSALSQEISALAALGNVDGVRARLDTLLAMPKEGSWSTPAWSMFSAAQELRAHGHPQAAREIAARAVAWHQSRPEKERAMKERRWHLGMVYYFLESWEDADALLRPLVAEFPNDVDYLGLLGTIAVRRGDHVLARTLVAKLASLDSRPPMEGATSILSRAKIAALLGDRAAAVSLLKDAYGAQGTLDLHADIDFEGLRDYPPFQEFTRVKG